MRLMLIKPAVSDTVEGCRLNDGRMERLQLGILASPFRFTENLLRGHRHLSGLRGAFFTSRATANGKLLARMLPLAMASRLFFPGRGFAHRWGSAMRISPQDHPILSVASAIVALLVLPMLASPWAGATIFFWLRRAWKLQTNGGMAYGSCGGQGKQKARVSLPGPDVYGSNGDCREG